MCDHLREQIALLLYLARWIAIATPLGVLVGSACAFFLWSLDRATHTRFANPWLLFFLPIAGLAIGWLYSTFGKSVEAGNNLVVDEIHEPGGGVPLRMAPLVLLSTVMTHLFGGSAGREGTAVQMGGSIASGLSRLMPRLEHHDTRKLLMAGIAAGFGGVFGTPVAGTIFAMEVLAMGRMTYAAILPCLVASIASDQTCVWWGIGHIHYRVASLLPQASTLHATPLEPRLLAVTVLAGALFGLTSLLFAELTHGLHAYFRKLCPRPLLRPVIGGVVVIGLVFVVGTRDYLGLGVTAPEPGAVTIVSSFRAGGATTWSWLWKIVFTAVTLSSGFKGGEVTPLFFIGAALGNTLAGPLGAPVDLFAALGFVSVFAGATNTPIACTFMAVELFGGEFTLYFATSCLMAYLFSGHSGIYLSQRIATPKISTEFWRPEASLRETRSARLSLRESPQSMTGRLSTLAKHDFSNGDQQMAHQHQVHSREIGQLRIYVPHGSRMPGKGLRKRLIARPLYRDLIDLAKADDLVNASAHPTQYGYTQSKRVEADDHEGPNPALNMCVELIDQREKLEQFCRKHAAVLKGHVIVYKHLEHWELHDNQLDVSEATVEELRDEDVTEGRSEK